MSKILERNEQKHWNWLLDYKEVVEWITQYKSERTQQQYMLRFSEFCRVAEITPIDLLEQIPEQSEELLKNILDKLSETHRYARLSMIQQSVNSYLRYYGKKISVSVDQYKDEFGRFVRLPDEEKVYGWLLEYDEIKIWIDNYTSKATRESYLGHMNAFLKRAELNPKELLKLSDNEVLMKYTLVKQLFLQKGTYSSARGIYKVVKSFFEAHRRVIPFSRQDKVPKRYKRVAEQHIPPKEEIYKMADSAGTLRNRAVILCLFQSGVRSNCIRRWNYRLVKDSLYPELKAPVHLKITKDFDTKLIGQVAYYYTFLQDEAAEALKTYLDYRIENEGWKPKDDDILFVSDTFYEKIRGTKRLYPVQINRIVKQCAKNIGLDVNNVWAHLLRKSFRKVLYSAPIDNDLAEAMMGHKLEDSKENYFDRYDVDMIASEYMKAPFSREGVGRLAHLEKEKQRLEIKLEDQETIIQELKRQLDERIKANHIKEQELEELKHTLKEHEALLKQLFKKLEED